MTSSRSGGRTGRPAEIPKVSDAFGIWLWFSREIESDLLRFYSVDVRDWFSGVMDSRRLISLLDGLPDESMFKTWAVRGGDWSEDQYVQARLVNEVALSRADGKGYMPSMLKSPMQIAVENSEDEYRSRRHNDALNELRGKEPSGDNA